MGEIFNTEEISSLFDTVTDDNDTQKKEPELDKLINTEEPELESLDKNISDSLFSDLENVEEKEESTSKDLNYGNVIKGFLERDESFQIYEDDDPENLNYTQEQFIDLIEQNNRLKGEQIANSVLEEVISNLSPSMQKLVTGELKGIKISDIIKDLEDYQEVENLPTDPTPEQKEKIVKKYYARLAKERGKDSEWVNSKVEKIIDNDDLDSEFEDAKDLFEKDLEIKQKQKEEELTKKEQEKTLFKKYHQHHVNEVLKEENIFNISLSKQEKDQVAQVLSTFLVRPTDKKEKLGLTALIDQYIHSDNPKESYKTLALMTLAGIAPEKLIQKLKNNIETKVTNNTVKQLKTISKQTIPISNDKKSVKKIGNVF